MMKLYPYYFIATSCLFISFTSHANQVDIIAAELTLQKTNQWTISVTLKHSDTGWDHYADAWRIIDQKGKILGERVLHHPHEHEQPFTRSLSNISLPTPSKTPHNTLYIEAHDKQHGWSKQRLSIDLSKAVNGYLRIPR